MKIFATGQIDHHFTDGLLDPTHSFVLSAEVDGPRMTFYINNKKMTTSVDNTYPDSYGIDFGVADSSENETLKALFSNFSYTPLS